jgi:hypothetical protein
MQNTDGIEGIEGIESGDVMELKYLETKTFSELMFIKHIPEVITYLKTFSEKIIDALLYNDCITGSIPYRGELTIQNLGELFIIMPDLYEYMKFSFSAIESGGDVEINFILDGCRNNTMSDIDINNADKYFKYIERTYYNEYLRGKCLVPFSIDDIERESYEITPFPREWFWWKKYNSSVEE